MLKGNYNIFNEDCVQCLKKMQDSSIDCVSTDPPYGIGYQAHEWDKAIPEIETWEQVLRVLKPGAFATVFSSVRLMHRMMVGLEDAGFLIKDVLFWSYLNGMPKSRNISLEIDKALGVESRKIGEYKYVQGYKKGGAENYYSPTPKNILEPSSEMGLKYRGAGIALKPAYEPIILVQKPIEQGLTIAQNIIKYGTGALNIEESRIPYSDDDLKVGHNPHPKGRVPTNILRMSEHEDGYDKFFMVPKVRQKKDGFNHHPTIKPVALMEHLIELTSFEGMTVLDPFLGSGTTVVSSLNLGRVGLGIEKSSEYFKIAQERIANLVGAAMPEKAKTHLKSELGQYSLKL